VIRGVLFWSLVMVCAVITIVAIAVHLLLALIGGAS
jgi:hypothetical protein